MAAKAKPRVCLGQILGAHGLAGEVQLRTFTDQPEDIAGYGPLLDESGTRSFEIVDLRPAKRGPVVRLKGVDDREAAEALKGARLYVERDRLPEPDHEEWYYADLIGLAAEDAQGTRLGSVVAVQNFGAGDLLEIKPTAGGPTLLVPFRRATVPEIDLDRGRLVVDPPEGLFEP
jgi:16S rRNA processing protein RimM